MGWHSAVDIQLLYIDVCFLLLLLVKFRLKAFPIHHCLQKLLDFYFPIPSVSLLLLLPSPWEADEPLGSCTADIGSSI